MNITDPSFVQRGFPFPSEYSWPHIIASCVTTAVVITLIVFGNLLVIIAVKMDAALKPLQNLYIASLAVSDLLLGLLIMPLSITNEVMGYWPFGNVLCSIWLSVDVFLCTASILNLCMISVDRYLSITRVTYSRSRSRSKVTLMIALVWLASAVICCPPLLGWERPQPMAAQGYPLCILSENVGYIVYSTCGSFFIPLAVMLIVYAKIYGAVRALARRSWRNRGVAALRATSAAPLPGDVELKDAEMCSLCNEPPERGVVTAYLKANSSCDSNVGKISASSSIAGVSMACVSGVNGGVACDDRSMAKGGEMGGASQGAPDTNRKLLRSRERRAIVVLGVIMVTFVVCWFPFFSAYLVSSVTGLHVHPKVFAVFFWIGYCNSALNPMIYTIFNREFRLAFERLICRQRNTKANGLALNHR